MKNVATVTMGPKFKLVVYCCIAAFAGGQFAVVPCCATDNDLSLRNSGLAFPRSVPVQSLVKDWPGTTSGGSVCVEAAVATQTTESQRAASGGLSNQPVSIASAVLAPEPLLPSPSVASPVSVATPLLFPEPSGAIIIDNDEQKETKATIEYQALPTDEGKTRITTGAKFPVVISSEISSKTAQLNDPIQARLKYDLKIGDRLIAPKGSPVVGHIDYVLKARTTMHSLVSPERWYRNSGTLGIAFDEIVNDKGEHLPLVAQPSRQARVVKNKGDGRELGINHHGQVTGPWSQQLKYKAVRIGLNAAMAPVGVFSFGAMPVALGVLGAACPSFAFMKPVGLNVRHRRIKGFAWGFLSGIPGSFLIEDTTVKGQEAIIKPGDEFLAEFAQEFTGEPATDAQLIPGATTKVHGQILSGNKRIKKKA